MFLRGLKIYDLHKNAGRVLCLSYRSCRGTAQHRWSECRPSLGWAWRAPPASSPWWSPDCPLRICFLNKRNAEQTRKRMRIKNFKKQYNWWYFPSFVITIIHIFHALSSLFVIFFWLLSLYKIYFKQNRSKRYHALMPFNKVICWKFSIFFIN